MLEFENAQIILVVLKNNMNLIQYNFKLCKTIEPDGWFSLIDWESFGNVSKSLETTHLFLDCLITSCYIKNLKFFPRYNDTNYVNESKIILVSNYRINSVCLLSFPNFSLKQSRNCTKMMTKWPHFVYYHSYPSQQINLN